MEHDIMHREKPKAILAGPVEYVAIKQEVSNLVEEASKYGLLGNFSEFDCTSKEARLFGLPLYPKQSSGIEFLISHDTAMDLARDTFRHHLEIVGQ